MTRAEDLLQALNGLQRAADSELSGDAREAASQYIKELFRFAGFDGEDAGEGRGEEAVPFAQALAEVRTQAEGELSGNAFELASIIFDDLASLSPFSGERATGACARAGRARAALFRTRQRNACRLSAGGNRAERCELQRTWRGLEGPRRRGCR